MALSRSKIKDLPSDAVVLTEEQAIKYQNKILNSWSNKNDVYAFKYGAYFLGFATFFTSTYINNHFRMKFKLRHYGLLSSILPVCILPTFGSIVVHQEIVLRKVVIADENTCPVCFEVKACALQALVGWTVPAIFGPLASMTIANSYHTYNIPYITDEPRKFWELLKQKFTPNKNMLLGLLVAQMLLASVVTYFEVDSVFRVRRKLSIMEELDLR